MYNGPPNVLYFIVLSILPSFLPSFLPPQSINPSSEDDATPSILSHARRSLAVVFKERPDRGRFKLLLLIVCTFINNLVAVGERTHSIHTCVHTRARTHTHTHTHRQPHTHTLVLMFDR